MTTTKRTLEEALASLRRTTLGQSPTGITSNTTRGEYENWRKEREEEKKRAVLDATGINKRFQGITFEAIEKRGLPENPNIRKNYKLVKDYAADLKARCNNGEGLIMAGDFGCMKTTFAVAILRSWLDKGGHGLMVPMASLIDNLSTLRELNRQEYAAYERKLSNISFLLLDDLGSENTNQQWIVQKVDSIITDRYNKLLPTIITTNLAKEELPATYGGRIVDRLRSTSLILEFTGRSERSKMR